MGHNHCGFSADAYNAVMPWGRGITIGCLLAMLPLGACGRLFKGGAGSVTVAKVRTQLTSPQVTVAGQLVASDRAEVKFPREVRIDKVYVNEGDRVNAGDPLLSLSQVELTNRLNQLRAQRKEAEAVLERNFFLLKSRDRLLDEGKMDATQHAGVESEVRANEATVERFRADIAALEAEVGASSVPSPIAGLVHQKLFNNGAVVGANQPICVIVRTDPILIWFGLTADEAMGITQGTPIAARIEELPGEQFAATVHHVGPELHQSGKTFDVWASIANPQEALKVGMRVFAEFTTTKQHQVYVIPAGAVIQRDGAPHVFVVQQGVAHATKIAIKGRSESEVTLVGGVGPDDLVVVKGQQGLQEGAMVDVWR